MHVRTTVQHAGEFAGHTEPALPDGRGTLHAACAQDSFLMCWTHAWAGSMSAALHEVHRGIGMLSRQWKQVSTIVLALACVDVTASAQQAKRPFTIADDIGLTLFAPQGAGVPEVH